jgi:Gas vesicle synthesis protein GvpL/GvpF
MNERSGLWVYAVTERPADAGRSTGIDGLPVRSVAGDGLVAVVSEVGMHEFGESALRAKFEDLGWLEATAKAHHQVIDDLASTQPVVPMRLATVFTSEASLQAMLAERGNELHEVLHRIGQRREWGVKAFAATAARTPKTRADAERGAMAAAGSGAAYLQRRRSQLDASNRARHEEARSAETVHASLSRLAADSRLHPPQVPQLAGTKAPMLLNASYLLDEASERGFSKAVQELAQQYRAIQLQLTGPWPPYSFASLDATLEAQA